MSTTREKVIANLRKNASTKEAFEAVTDPVQGLSTGCLGLDLITGIGGWPVGRISEIFGWEYSGKTTICVASCAAAQARGQKPVYIDAENGLDRAYADKLGFNTEDTDQGLYVVPKSFEQTLEILVPMVESGESPLIIVDSIPALTPESELAGDFDKAVIGARARLLATTLPKIKDLVKVHNTALVFVNQMRQKLVIGHVPAYMIRREDTEQSSGGSALKFFSSLRVDMRIAKRGDTKLKKVDWFTGKEEDIPTGNLHEAKTIKNRHAAPYKKAVFDIRYDETSGLYGIDNLATYVAVGVTLGVVGKNGGWLEFGDVKVNGVDEFIEALREDPQTAFALAEAVERLPEIAAILARRLV